MSDDKTSTKLAVPRTGVVVLDRVNSKAVLSQEGNFVAAWQTTEKGAPRRVVVRCDGIIKNQNAESGSGAGYPCAVLNVRYTIGGLTKLVNVDAVCQSALTLWTESVDVEAVWDQRRIDRLAAQGHLPCKSQALAAAIDFDPGVADARYLDVIAVDRETETPALEWSIHPIPEGARGLRFLDALVAGAMFSVPGATTIIAWSADTFDKYPTGVIQLNTNGATDTSILIVPAGARFLFLAFPISTVGNFDVPSFIEWILSPDTLSGY